MVRSWFLSANLTVFLQIANTVTLRFMRHTIPVPSSGRGCALVFRHGLLRVNEGIYGTYLGQRQLMYRQPRCYICVATIYSGRAKTSQEYPRHLSRCPRSGLERADIISIVLYSAMSLLKRDKYADSLNTACFSLW